MYMPWGIAANYARSDSFFEAVYPERAEVSPTGVAAPLVSIAPLMESASRQWHGAAVGNVRIVNPGDKGVIISIRRSPAYSIGSSDETLMFEGATGRSINAGAGQSRAMATQGVMIGDRKSTRLNYSN